MEGAPESGRRTGSRHVDSVSQGSPARDRAARDYRYDGVEGHERDGSGCWDISLTRHANSGRPSLVSPSGKVKLRLRPDFGLWNRKEDRKLILGTEITRWTYRRLNSRTNIQTAAKSRDSSKSLRYHPSLRSARIERTLHLCS